MRSQVVAALAALGSLLGLALVGAQGLGKDASLEARLRSLFPTATSFSDKIGEPPHYEAWQGSGGSRAIVGHAFWTTDVLPLERGYDGPIAMLVGLALDARLTGVIVAGHREPYGYFSVDPPVFAAQFKGKDVRDQFLVGDDVDAVSRASITVTSAARVIRNSARRVARAYLTPPAPPGR
jgi:NosR/NirI family nitrous oxide reductase transcriptional regulator